MTDVAGGEYPRHAGLHQIGVSIERSTSSGLSPLRNMSGPDVRQIPDHSFARFPSPPSNEEPAPTKMNRADACRSIVSSKEVSLRRTASTCSPPMTSSTVVFTSTSMLACPAIWSTCLENIMAGLSG